jgi:Carboxypeptidase regulatory-like domain
MRLFLPLLLLSPYLLSATEHGGSVRSADQLIPGATVTASNGGAKIVAYTDENGRYTLDLTPGEWDLQVDMFGFLPAHAKIVVGAQPTHKDWTLEVPRYGKGPALAAAPAGAKPAAAAASGVSTTQAVAGTAAPSTAAAPASGTTGAATSSNGQKPGAALANNGRSGRYGQGRGGYGQGRGGYGQGQGRGGRNGQQGQNPNFQSVQVTATDEGAQALAAQGDNLPEVANADSAESFLVNGSQSGGLAAAADEQALRDRMAGRGGRGPGGPGGPGNPGQDMMMSLAAAGRFWSGLGE